MDLASIGVPVAELTRSPAARKIAELAAASKLFLYHFEYRYCMSAAAQFLPDGLPDQSRAAAWQAGILPENKYAAFRNDLALGSYHPGHRAKWTTHELCHGLVGFAWHPGATPFFHALAARLAELLPVALYYFFDEAQLNRCPAHEGGGPLFAAFCPDCETAACQGPREHDADADRYYAEGMAFIDRELAAVARSRRLGRPLASPWANLDLASDGLTYAAMQANRLATPEFERYVTLFCSEDAGLHQSLESLEARILELATAIVKNGQAKTWLGSRGRWIAQDLGWRLIEVQAQSDGEVAIELDRMITNLAAAQDETAIADTIKDYQALHKDYHLPNPEDLFAVGYPLPGGMGLSLHQIQAGIDSACPRTMAMLPESATDRIGVRKRLVVDFATQDRLERKPLGQRFAHWLASRESGDVLTLAKIESAMAHAPPADATTLSLGVPTDGDLTIRIDPAVRFFRCNAAVMGRLGLEAVEGQDCLLAIRRDSDGDIALLNLDLSLEELLTKLQQGPLPHSALELDEEVLETLLQAHVLAPDRWLL